MLNSGLMRRLQNVSMYHRPIVIGLLAICINGVLAFGTMPYHSTLGMHSLQLLVFLLINCMFTDFECSLIFCCRSLFFLLLQA